MARQEALLEQILEELRAIRRSDEDWRHRMDEVRVENEARARRDSQALTSLVTDMLSSFGQRRTQ